MANNYTDWKTDANGYLVKGMAMSVVLVMFLLLVMPRFEGSSAEDVIKEDSKVSEHFEFEEVAQEEEVEEVEPEEQEQDIIEEATQAIDLDFENMSIEEMETATVRKTISATDVATDLNISFSGIDEASLNQPYVAHEEMPIAITAPKPIYPDIAKQNEVEGTIVVEVWVKVDGSVGNVRVIKSLQSIPGGLDDAVVNAVRRWTFQPAKSGGRPVACWARIPINMKLEE